MKKKNFFFANCKRGAAPSTTFNEQTKTEESTEYAVILNAHFFCHHSAKNEKTNDNHNIIFFQCVFSIKWRLFRDFN